jgi:hypothetical protein
MAHIRDKGLFYKGGDNGALADALCECARRGQHAAERAKLKREPSPTRRILTSLRIVLVCAKEARVDERREPNRRVQRAPRG